MGEVLEWGKTYPVFTRKENLGKDKNGDKIIRWTTIPGESEIKKALCKSCMVEVSKKQYDLQD